MPARLAVAVALALCLLLLPAAQGAGEAAAAAGSDGGDRLPGVEIAQALATATGIAITPLLGVSAVGAWKAYRAPTELRGELPWYAARWFWIPGLTIALLLVFKDPVLGLVPGAKKPLDAIDVLENKVSALLAAPAVVPMFVSAALATRGLAAPAGEPAAAVRQAALAALPGLRELPEVLVLGIATALFLAGFFCVWLAFHTINVLILLSPFGPVDMLLRMGKLLFLAVLVGGTLVHPYLGLLVVLAIVTVSVRLAGWSFRLTVFGAVMAADLVTWRHRRVRLDPARLVAFVAEPIGAAPTRSYGRVERTGERLHFSWRPWLVLPRRAVVLPADRYHLGRGLVCPLVRRRAEGGGAVALLRLPPRYRYHDDELVAMLELAGVEELALRRGLRAIVSFVRDMAGSGRETARPAAPLGT